MVIGIVRVTLFVVFPTGEPPCPLSSACAVPLFCRRPQDGAWNRKDPDVSVFRVWKAYYFLHLHWKNIPLKYNNSIFEIIFSVILPDYWKLSFVAFFFYRLSAVFFFSSNLWYCQLRNYMIEFCSRVKLTWLHVVSVDVHVRTRHWKDNCGMGPGNQ